MAGETVATAADLGTAGRRQVEMEVEETAEVAVDLEVIVARAGEDPRVVDQITAAVVAAVDLAGEGTLAAHPAADPEAGQVVVGNKSLIASGGRE